MAPGGIGTGPSRRPDAVADPKAAAAALAAILGGDAASYEERLAERRPRPRSSPRITDSDQRAKVQKRDRRRTASPACRSTPAPLVAVADAKGVELIDPATGELVDDGRRRRPAHGLALATVGDAKLYVATDPEPTTGAPGRMALVAVGGDGAKNGPVVHDRDADAGPGEPGPLRRRDRDGPRPRPDARTASTSTVYVIERATARGVRRRGRSRSTRPPG